MNQVDKTGEPRSPEDYEEALAAVNGAIISVTMNQPALAIHLPTIRDGLIMIIAVYKKKAAKA